jgi:hypothetical protein
MPRVTRFGEKALCSALVQVKCGKRKPVGDPKLSHHTCSNELFNVYACAPTVVDMDWAWGNEKIKKGPDASRHFPWKTECVPAFQSYSYREAA